MEYLGIVLGAVAYIIIGMIWFGPLFGKVWMKSIKIKKLRSGWTEQDSRLTVIQLKKYPIFRA